MLANLDSINVSEKMLRKTQFRLLLIVCVSYENIGSKALFIKFKKH